MVVVVFVLFAKEVGVGGIGTCTGCGVFDVVVLTCGGFDDECPAFLGSSFKVSLSI